jgi:hypothetical protein
MSTKKRKNMTWSLREAVFKIAIMTVTVSIGLWCGWSDSYSSFYIAVLVQSINNLYDSSAFFAGYTKFITTFQLIAFVGALISAILSIIHFTKYGSIVDNLECVIGIAIALSIPIVHFGIEVYSMIRQDRY